MLRKASDCVDLWFKKCGHFNYFRSVNDLFVMVRVQFAIISPLFSPQWCRLLFEVVILCECDLSMS